METEEVTEKLYIGRLKIMIAMYQVNLKTHCPMAIDFSADQEMDYDKIQSCGMCQKVHDKYIELNSLRIYHCPCYMYRGFDMYNIASKVVRAWEVENEKTK